MICWLVIAINFLIVLGWIGVAIRRQSPALRAVVLIVVPLILLISVVVLGSFISFDLHKFDATTGSCDSGCVVERAEFAARRWEYVLVLSLPKPLRPSCESLPDLCEIERRHDLFNVSFGIGAFIGLAAFFVVFFASRNPVTQES